MSDETLELLRRIAKDVADIKAAMSASVTAQAASLGLKLGGNATGASGGVASDAELDGQYGDPVIKKDPGRWRGESFAGCTYSQTSPEYLDCLADLKEWMAQKDDAAGAKDSKGRAKSTWSIKEARLARGWAARLRAGWKPASANGTTGGARAASDEDYDDAGGYGDEVPF